MLAHDVGRMWNRHTILYKSANFMMIAFGRRCLANSAWVVLYGYSREVPWESDSSGVLWAGSSVGQPEIRPNIVAKSKEAYDHPCFAPPPPILVAERVLELPIRSVA